MIADVLTAQAWNNRCGHVTLGESVLVGLFDADMSEARPLELDTMTIARAALPMGTRRNSSHAGSGPGPVSGMYDPRLVAVS